MDPSKFLLYDSAALAQSAAATLHAAGIVPRRTGKTYLEFDSEDAAAKAKRHLGRPATTPKATTPAPATPPRPRGPADYQAAIAEVKAGSPGIGHQDAVKKAHARHPELFARIDTAKRPPTEAEATRWKRQRDHVVQRVAALWCTRNGEADIEKGTRQVRQLYPHLASADWMPPTGQPKASAAADFWKLIASTSQSLGVNRGDAIQFARILNPEFFNDR